MNSGLGLACPATPTCEVRSVRPDAFYFKSLYLGLSTFYF